MDVSPHPELNRVSQQDLGPFATDVFILCFTKSCARGNPNQAATDLNIWGSGRQIVKQGVYLCQVNYQFGNNVFLPYSAGLLKAYCRNIPEINDNYEFKPFIFLREEPAKLAGSLEDPNVLGISCYVWNWQWSKSFAKAVKDRFPNCLVVLGGPHVPSKSESFFADHDYVDMLVHHEGEIAFSEILLEKLKDAPDFTTIAGLSVRILGTRCHRTPDRQRNLDLSIIPSPYLTGDFDGLLKDSFTWNACQETHRGCPYSCTFCDWGSAVYTKVRTFDDERLVREFEWMGKNRIELLYNCDANYGLFPRDMELTRKMVETKQELGYPKQFRAAFAKNSTTRVYEIARMLNEARMDKGITISFQSMNTSTLEAIKRINIRVRDFENLMKLYRAKGIRTYSELIIALPGETYDSFANGIDELLRAGQHDGLNIYVCHILPNAEMAEPNYREMFGMKTIRSPMQQFHSSPAPEEITEYTDYVIETSTLPLEDWKRTYYFSWAVQSFHCLGLTQSLAVFLHAHHGLSYRTFYEKLLEYAAASPRTLLGREYAFVRDLVENVLRGASWEQVIPEFGNVTWPTEEATFLRLVEKKELFYTELEDFLKQLDTKFGWQINSNLMEDLMNWQKVIVMDPYSPKELDFDLDHNLHEYFEKVYMENEGEFVRKECHLTAASRGQYNGDMESFAREVVWYGRKGSRFQRMITPREVASGS